MCMALLAAVALIVALVIWPVIGSLFCWRSWGSLAT
jgi:hypothetical protein